jgi:hypothetical protein
VPRKPGLITNALKVFGSKWILALPCAHLHNRPTPVLQHVSYQTSASFGDNAPALHTCFSHTSDVRIQRWTCRSDYVLRSRHRRHQSHFGRRVRNSRFLRAKLNRRRGNGSSLLLLLVSSGSSELLPFACGIADRPWNHLPVLAISPRGPRLIE